jgi:hypothetical protein
MTAPVAKIIAGLSADKRSRIAAALADLQEAFGAPKESTNVR